METGELDISSPSEMTKVSVAVRVRPLIEREKKGDAQIHWQIGPQDLRPFDPEAKRIVPNSSTYTYDHVFTQSTQTQQVYDKVVSPIVKQAFKGFNGTILCYGQTSSGKTHTLYGSNDDKGIILLFADHLFQQIKADETGRQYIIKVGLIEIYNEKVSDLLNSYNPIELQERDGSIVPHGLEELTVFDIDDWKKVTERVQRERKIGETRMNKESSRSHTILRVTIESFDLTSNGSFDEAQENSEQSPPLTTAVLHFVDLAGSEKQSQTGAEGERFREQVNINMSLSVLSRVIQQLSEQASVSSFEGRSSSNDHSLAKAMVNSMVRTAPRPRFINFRDSKLTRLLQNSLNGNAYISMVCNVTIASFEETKSTLLFAQQAKKIQIRPKQNRFSTKSEYDKKLKELHWLRIIQARYKEEPDVRFNPRNNVPNIPFDFFPLNPGIALSLVLQDHHYTLPKEPYSDRANDKVRESQSNPSRSPLLSSGPNKNPKKCRGVKVIKSIKKCTIRKHGERKDVLALFKHF
ncbi:unnamed protein product [Orchesella dallaii]|uniref:Kinesin motor domain-containing protein n=1 Tax=Orchesella dallaii TaxID=48710 RepID=A0ABP1PYF8_9HEXA